MTRSPTHKRPCRVCKRWFIPASAPRLLSMHCHGKGELDKDGFKVVYSYIGSRAMDENFDWEECEWEISEKRDNVDLDCGE